MTDREREEVDANAKQMIRELNASIRAMDDAEQLRRETEAAIIRKKFGSTFGVLGSWASGGLATGKSDEQADAEARAQQTEIHRDGVMWFLRQRLELCCRTQQDMMETRLMREMEKTRGFMGGAPAGDFAEFAQSARSPPTANAGAGAGEGASSSSAANQGLTDEQMRFQISVVDCSYAISATVVPVS